MLHDVRPRTALAFALVLEATAMSSSREYGTEQRHECSRLCRAAVGSVSTTQRSRFLHRAGTLSPLASGGPTASSPWTMQVSEMFSRGNRQAGGDAGRATLSSSAAPRHAVLSRLLAVHHSRRLATGQQLI